MTDPANVSIDLNPVVSAILQVLTEPYQAFVAQLQADGRITPAEVDELTAAILDRGDRLADLVQEALRQSTPVDPRSA